MVKSFIGISKIDQWCVINEKDENWNIIEEKERHNCEHCEHQAVRNTCISHILTLFNNKAVEKLLKLRKDLSYEFLESHPNIIKSMK